MMGTGTTSSSAGSAGPNSALLSAFCWVCLGALIAPQLACDAEVVPRVQDAGSSGRDGGETVYDAGAVDAGSARDSGPTPGTDGGPGCVPHGCGDVGIDCGSIGDGCGGSLNCGTCAAGATCDSGHCSAPPPDPVDCTGIASTPGYELCESSATTCAGVYSNSSNCTAFCAAAGLDCVGHFGGEPGCMGPETVSYPCSTDTGHVSDWCVCEGEATTPPPPTCGGDPGSRTMRSMHYRDASFSPRSSWVLTCRDYAYTARFDEHEACDASYRAGSGVGTATFHFSGVPTGSYDVFVSGMHTNNRNPSGMLVRVSSGPTVESARISQRDGSNAIQNDLVGRYCVSGTIDVVIDSSTAQSDSVRTVSLVPAG